MKQKLAITAVVALLFIIASLNATAQSISGGVMVLVANGPVTPVMVSHIERGIARAEAENATALVIELNTPGGQTDLTRNIIQTILNARVPVVVYVYPPGGFAASAGTFITLAGHVAAMAPNTSIGAASPVNMQGGNIDTTLRAKLENILVADMENLAERRGEKAVQFATDAIRKARAANAKTALSLGVIDIIAPDLNNLLVQLDGREVQLLSGTRTLHTTGVPITRIPMTFAEQILSVILRPEIAFMLLAIGPLAIIYELASPGGYIGGVIGVICTVLGLYAIGQLPVNYAGIALLVLALALFTADIFAPTHGVLTTAAVVSLAFGGLLMFNQAELGYQVSVGPIIAVAAALGLIFFFIVSKAVATLKMQPVSGEARILGMTGIAKTPLDPDGIVLVDGARWQAATTGQPIATGDIIRVETVSGLHLTVQKVPSIKK